MADIPVIVEDCGDSAITVRTQGDDAEAAWRYIHNLSDAIAESESSGVRGLVPTYDALLVEFDCSQTDHAALRELIDSLTQDPRLARTRVAGRDFTVPVVYGGTFGPDLGLVAGQLGLTEREVIDRHTARRLTVRCLGAPAGSPMMDGPDFGAPVPRLASPRVSVPAGSVAVAGRQAVISPMPSPGGWAVIGRTPLRIIDIKRDPIVAYSPGDRFRFTPIASGQWDTFAGARLEPDSG